MTKPNLCGVSINKVKIVVRYIPLALAGVLLDDGLARFDLTEPRSPTMKIFVSSIWHETTNVDVGDSFWVLQTLGQTELLLVGPESRHGSWEWWITHDKFIEVDHFIAFVVLGLHGLDGPGNVCLIVDSGLVWIAGIEFRGRGTTDRNHASILVVLGPDSTLSRLEVGHAWLVSKTMVVLCHWSLRHVVHVTAVHAVLMICSLFILALSWWEES